MPQDPLTLKLRLDTNDALASSVQRRRYALKVPAAHFYIEIVDRVPLPRSGRKNRASEQREDIFGHRKAVGADAPWLPLERICAQYGFRFLTEKNLNP